MIDNDMTNILKNFSNADAGTGEIVDDTGKRKASVAATEKNAIKSLLEGLDAQQKSVNQMPSTHKMAKNTANKHPAEKFLVGGEFDNPREYPGNDAKDDYYEDTIAKKKPGSDVHKKQSFKDVFRSMDETEEELAGRFKKELHNEKTSRALSKGANGKFDLSEQPVDEADERFHNGEPLSWGDELVEDLKLLLNEAEDPHDVVRGVADLINQYEDSTINEMNVISSEHDSPIDQVAEALGKALFVEGVVLAKEVYDEEGSGRRSGARDKPEYVEEALRKFLSKEYLRDIMGNIIESYNENVAKYRAPGIK